jgi:hypothetical protein
MGPRSLSTGERPDSADHPQETSSSRILLLDVEPEMFLGTSVSQMKLLQLMEVVWWTRGSTSTHSADVIRATKDLRSWIALEEGKTDRAMLMLYFSTPAYKGLLCRAHITPGTTGTLNCRGHTY